MHPYLISDVSNCAGKRLVVRIPRRQICRRAVEWNEGSKTYPTPSGITEKAKGFSHERNERKASNLTGIRDDVANA